MKRYYAFDLCPGFWTSLVEQYTLGRVFSIDRVRDELDAVDDELETLGGDSDATGALRYQ